MVGLGSAEKRVRVRDGGSSSSSSSVGGDGGSNSNSSSSSSSSRGGWGGAVDENQFDSKMDADLHPNPNLLPYLPPAHAHRGMGSMMADWSHSYFLATAASGTRMCLSMECPAIPYAS